MPNTTYTTNLNLTKPAYDDPADIAVINSNMDTIDTNIKALQDDPGLSKNWVSISGEDIATILSNIDAKFSTNGHFFGYATSTIAGRLGLPSTNYYIVAQAYTASTRILHAIPYTGGKIWYLTKTSGTWGGTWSQLNESDNFITFTGSTSQTQAQLLEIIDNSFSSTASGHRFGYIPTAYVPNFGLPTGTGYYLTVISYGVHRIIQAVPLEGGDVYYLYKRDGVWGTEWTTNVNVFNRFGGSTEITDLNDEDLRSGIYHTVTTTNANPPVEGTYTVLNMRYGSYAQQIAMARGTNLPSIYVRTLQVTSSSPNMIWNTIQRYQPLGTISATTGGNSGVQLTFGSQFRGIIVSFNVSSLKNRAWGIWMVVATSSTVYVQEVLAGESISYEIASSGRQLTITTTHTSSAVLYAVCFNSMVTANEYIAYEPS